MLGRRTRREEKRRQHHAELTRSQRIAVSRIIGVYAAQQQLLCIRSAAVEVTLKAGQSLSIGIDSTDATDPVVVREA